MEAYFSGDIPPLNKVEAFLYVIFGGIFSVRAYLHSKKVEAFLYGNFGGIFSVKAYLHPKKVEAFLYGNCKCRFKIPLIFQYLHIFPVEAYFSGDIPPLK